MKIYILKLENDKYYVGKTSNNSTRIQEHFDDSKKSSSWTTKYKPISVDQIIENCDEFDEDKWVKIYMKKHGIDNVRGGSYASSEKLHHTVKYFLEHEIEHAESKCFSCGKSGHLSMDCSKNNTRIKVKICGNCGNKGHTESKCYVKSALKSELESICSKCGKSGHYDTDCYIKSNDYFKYR